MNTNVVSGTAEAGIDRGGSFVRSFTPAASDDTRAPFRIQVPTPVPSSPSQPVSAGSLAPESFGKLLNSMYEEMASVCETTGETLDLGKLAAKADNGSMQIAVTLCQISPGRLSGYMEIELANINSENQGSCKRAFLRVNNLWWTNPDVEGFKKVYLPNALKQGRWRGFLGVTSNRAEHRFVRCIWTLCRVIYERYVVLHNVEEPFDLTELPKRIQTDEDIEILWDREI